MANLPDLSKLKINGNSKAYKTESVTAPRPGQIPLLDIFNIRLKQRTTFDFEGDHEYPYLFTDEEMVFSCVNGQIAMDSREESKAVLEDFFDPLMRPDWALQEFAHDQGGFNYTTTLVRDDLVDPAWTRKIYTYVDSIKGSRIESVVLRASKMAQTKRMMHRLDMNDENITNTKDRLFQELFLTLYAAKVGIGPEIYACQMKPIAQRVEGKIDMYPRVIYIMEAGQANLRKACELTRQQTFFKPSMDPQMDLKLFELLKKASMASILMLDIKPGNIVAFLGPDKRTFTELKFIDFATDFATYVHGGNPECIMFANCVMLALFVGTKYNTDSQCMLPMMKPVFEYIKSKQERYDNGNHMWDGPLCMQVQQAMFSQTHDKSKTLLDENGQTPKLVSAMIERAKFYALSGLNMQDPDEFDVPELFRDIPYDPDKPFLQQLIRNFLLSYQESGLVDEDDFYSLPNAQLRSIPLSPAPPAQPPPRRRNPPRNAGVPRRYADDMNVGSICQ